MILDTHVWVHVGRPELKGLARRLKRTMTFENPRYNQAKRFSRFVSRRIPRELRYFEEAGEWLKLPRGLGAYIYDEIKRLGLKPSVSDRRIERSVSYPPLLTELRPYQKEALDQFLKYRSGLIVLPAGAGKTQVGIACAFYTGQKTLWITHTKDLAEQAAERFEDLLGVEVGLIGDGSRTVGNEVTVAIINSLAKMDLSDLAQETGLVIVDECHHVPADLMQKVVNQFPARNRLGLTATPERADGLAPLIHAIMGPVLYKTTYPELARQGYIVLPKLCIVKTSFYYDYTDPKDYSDMVNQACRDADRNGLILQHLRREIEAGRFCLVLTARKDHCEKLGEHLKRLGYRAAWASSKLGRQERRRIREQALNGELQVLVATQLADEGLDLPGIEALFLAAPGGTESRIEQRVGRTTRIKDGKQQPVVYDFVDVNVGVLVAQFRKRLDVYRRMGIEIPESALKIVQ